MRTSLNALFVGAALVGLAGMVVFSRLPNPPERASLTDSAVVTVYWLDPAQTDDSFNITADGSVIEEAAVAGVRWCAVSRDLLSRWGGPLNYGDQIEISGTVGFDGVWTIHDTMNRRFGRTAPTYDAKTSKLIKPVAVDGFHHIDLLVPRGTLGKWTDVTVRRLED